MGPSRQQQAEADPLLAALVQQRLMAGAVTEKQAQVWLMILVGGAGFVTVQWLVVVVVVVVVVVCTCIRSMVVRLTTTLQLRWPCSSATMAASLWMAVALAVKGRSQKRHMALVCSKAATCASRGMPVAVPVGCAKQPRWWLPVMLAWDAVGLALDKARAVTIPMRTTMHALVYQAARSAAAIAVRVTRWGCYVVAAAGKALEAVPVLGRHPGTGMHHPLPAMAALAVSMHAAARLHYTELALQV